MKFKNGFEIVSMTERIGQVKLSSPFGAGDIRASEKLADKLKNIGNVSQWTQQNKQDNFNFENVSDILPKDEDYIFVNFRALSKVVIPGHWLDWTTDGVLEAGVKMLQGATVYPNHNFFDINNWLGSVNNSVWDAEGKNAGGIPGINAEYKIDALMNPRIARGLLMNPPAIHSTSLTVLFEFEYSHPDIAADDKWKFYRLLGEEVESKIVRFIVTKIREIWEASLVFQGADRLAKKSSDDGDDEDDESLSAAETHLPTNSNEEKTMKIEKQKRTELGIEFDGDDVPETEVFSAAERLAAQLKPYSEVNLSELQASAAAGEKFITKQRDEVRRLARLSELGAEAGDLPEVVEMQIDDASFDTLVKLEKHYQTKVADKFPNLSRSSQENSDAIENAGNTQVKKQTVAPISLH